MIANKRGMLWAYIRDNPDLYSKAEDLSSAEYFRRDKQKKPYGNLVVSELGRGEGVCRSHGILAQVNLGVDGAVYFLIAPYHVKLLFGAHFAFAGYLYPVVVEFVVEVSLVSRNGFAPDFYGAFEPGEIGFGEASGNRLSVYRSGEYIGSFGIVSGRVFRRSGGGLHFYTFSFQRYFNGLGRTQTPFGFETAGNGFVADLKIQISGFDASRIRTGIGHLRRKYNGRPDEQQGSGDGCERFHTMNDFGLISTANKRGGIRAVIRVNPDLSDKMKPASPVLFLV